MKVLVADKFPESGILELKSIVDEVVYEPDAKDEQLLEKLRSTRAEVLVVRSNKVNAAMLEQGALSLVIRAGAGVNTIDVQTASALGIYVSNCPGKNAVAVAELAFGLMLSLDRRIPDNVLDLRQGKWNKKEYSKARGLRGRTLGLIGLGNIGMAMMTRAKAFGMKVVAWSRSLTLPRASDLEIEYRSSPEEVAASCQILSVHVPLSSETKGMIGKAILDRLSKGAYFINTSRAEVVDHQALKAAIQERGLRVGLDVFEKEPSGGTGTFEDDIAQLPGVYGTHHIGASTDEAQDEIAREAVRIVRVFKETGDVPNVVNMARRSPASHLLVVRHRDKVGVLAHVFSELRSVGINVQETQNQIFEGARAAIARIALDRGMSASELEQLRRGNEDILDLKLLPVIH